MTLPGHADIDDEFLGSSQAGELEMISPTRITRSNSAREGAALIERLALESKTGADLGVAPKLSNSKNGDGRNEGLSWEHGQHEGSKDGQHGNSSSPEISCTERAFTEARVNQEKISDTSGSSATTTTPPAKTRKFGRRAGGGKRKR